MPNLPTVTIEQIAAGVRHSDFMADNPCMRSNMKTVIEIALKKLGIAAPIRIDLENGHSLIVAQI